MRAYRRRVCIYLSSKYLKYIILLRCYVGLTVLYGAFILCQLYLPRSETPGVNKSSTKVPLVVIWTYLQNDYNDWLYDIPIDLKEKENILAHRKEISPPISCPKCSCSLTFNRDFLQYSDAVLISLYDANICLYLNKIFAQLLNIFTFGFINENLCWFPEASFGEGKDVFLFFEEPPNILFYRMNQNKAMDYFESRIDYTISYRRDSTIFKPYITPSLEVQFNSNSTNPFVRDLAQTSLIPVKIAWMVSNCHSASGREEYVSALSQFVNVTVIGRCGEDLCSLKDNSIHDCMDFLIDNGYTFYLSFENEICSDYITEKFEKTLTHDIVPIVMSGSLNNVQDIIPPKSAFIDISDFKSPEELSKYLLSMTKQKWMSHFEWKKRKHLASFNSYGNTSVIGEEPSYFCQLCHLISQKRETKAALSLRNSLISWWNNQICLPSWKNIITRL